MRIEWTSEQDVILRDLFNEGFSDRQIAKYFQCGSTSIENRRKRLGLRRSYGGQVKPPDAPTDRYPTGPEIDAMFRAHERPVKREIEWDWRRHRQPTLTSNGCSMT